MERIVPPITMTEADVIMLAASERFSGVYLAARALLLVLDQSDPSPELHAAADVLKREMTALDQLIEPWKG